jgi:IS30 family transposase
VPAGARVRTITPDNRPEFAEFRGRERDTGGEVYFTEPRPPRQRGTNENTEGLLRFYVPKGRDFRAVRDEGVKEAVGLLNHRPRKYLGWLSPEEFSLFTCALNLAFYRMCRISDPGERSGKRRKNILTTRRDGG